MEVTLDTFPFQKYGTLPGKLLSIIPDAYDDPQLGPVYKIMVGLDQMSLVVDGQKMPVAPGMTVSTKIKTGKRRIIGFFLSPIVKYAKESLAIR
ncbi:hypothetical protein [Heliophilum fasciatum]|uniref:AprE-like beta-barrel domain-containing protein n=1 Tax=Heliophilum fasciatum TaxID=35700 RepID=A0A4R2QXR6_9FIRM|nr:multidrug efflux pump subunit AcrA (membrane-fusion protein) [Heliophilum fasciatum]TCP53959.1 hypothetical protein EDD73_1671 [Heliophilum fasciatum]